MNEELFRVNKESHLKKEIGPIITCLINEDSDNPKQKEEIRMLLESGELKAENVNLDGHYDELKRAGYLTGNSDHTYVISPISESNKFSEGYVNCTGVVVSGKDKLSGKYISFLTHQNPRYFLSSSQFEFVSDLQARLQEMKERCEEGTIDAVTFGGMYDDLDPENIISEKYKESIELISNEVRTRLGFKPAIVNGPKMDNLFGGIGKDNFYFDNENKRAYFVRPKVNQSI